MPKRRSHARLATVATPVAPQRGTYITLSVPEDSRLAGAVCREVTPDVFFPDPDDEFSEMVAKRLCAACPIRPLCLAGAIERDERFGIFGGLDTAERDALTGRRGGCGTRNGYRRHVRAEEPACRACRAAHTAATAADRVKRNAARQPAPGCGTRFGYQQHRAAGERVCAACIKANAAYNRAHSDALREDRARTRAAQPTDSRCGTRHGYHLHRVAGEPACTACLEANTAYSRAYHAARRTTPAAAIGAVVHAAKKARAAGPERSDLEAAA